MRPYGLSQSEDDLWMIVRGDQEVGRALTKRDGEAIVDELNGQLKNHIRDQLIDGITDVIENCFDEVP